MQPDAIPLVTGAAMRPAPRTHRRIVNAAMVGHFLALRHSLLLCGHCEGKMPRGWLSRYEYTRVERFHGSGRCDYCRVDQPGNLFVPEEQGYAQELRFNAQFQARKVGRVAVTDRRRIRA